MNNSILTPKIFAKLVLMNLGGSLHVCRNMSHQVTREFAQKGNKVGATVQVRRPYRFTVATGLDYQPQPLVDTTLPVTVARTAQVSYDWDSVEGALSIREAQELYAKPAGLALASNINAAAAQFVGDNLWNNTGTPGTAPTGPTSYLNAGDLIVAQGLPEEEELNLILNRRMSTAFVTGTQTLFNPTGQVSSQAKQGRIVDETMGYEIHRDETINKHTNGTWTTVGLVNAANQTADGGNNGTIDLVTKSWDNSAAPGVGDKFSIGSASDATAVSGGVQSVHPQTRVGTGYQQQFTILAIKSANDGSGNITLTVAPAITPYGQYQNVDAAPVANAKILMAGASGAVGTEALLLHKDAMAFVSVPMLSPGPGEGAVVANETDPETGISLQLIKAFDSFHRVHIHRIDVLYDFARMYAEMGAVIWG